MKKKLYEKPAMKVVELQHKTQLLQASGTGSQGAPNYNPFDDEEYW